MMEPAANYVSRQFILIFGITLSLAMGCNNPPPPETQPPPSPTMPAPPPGMVHVPGGTFTIGSNDFTDTKPINGVTVASFYLDIIQVTGADYQACIKAGSCTVPKYGVKLDHTFNYDRDLGQVVPGKERHPINGVTFQQAKHYCQMQGKRLPTEIEWEYAARGPAESLYPWGNTPVPDAKNPTSAPVCWNRLTAGTCPVQSYGATLLGMNENQLDAQKIRGVYDLGGNVSEWVGTRYFTTLSAIDEPCPDLTADCVLRGGDWFNDFPSALRASLRFHLYPTEAAAWLGFRCAKSE